MHKKKLLKQKNRNSEKHDKNHIISIGRHLAILLHLRAYIKY